LSFLGQLAILISKWEDDDTLISNCWPLILVVSKSWEHSCHNQWTLQGLRVQTLMLINHDATHTHSIHPDKIRSINSLPDIFVRIQNPRTLLGGLPFNYLRLGLAQPTFIFIFIFLKKYFYLEKILNYCFFMCVFLIVLIYWC
jgi:hypothetical protein